MCKLRLTRKARLLAVLPWQGETVAVYAMPMFVGVHRRKAGRGRQVFVDVSKELQERANEAAWEAEKAELDAWQATWEAE